MDRADLTLSASGPGVSERDSVISIRNGVYKPPEGAPARTIRKDRNEARIAGLGRSAVHLASWQPACTGLCAWSSQARARIRAIREIRSHENGTAMAASASTSRFRVEWTADPARGRWQRVCGYIYNDTPDAPREVRLLVEGRDQAERVIDAQVVPVLGYITPWGRTYFCSTATAGAARYSVTVIGAEVTSDR
jgi:hypothetical protein